jgi:hypothetical protein
MIHQIDEERRDDLAPARTTGVSTSRRAFMNKVVAVSVAAAVPTTAPAMQVGLNDKKPDPVYAAIEQHKKLSVAYDAAVNHPGVGDDDPRFAEVNKLSDQSMWALFRGSEKLFDFKPTTQAGITSLLLYITTLDDWQMPGGFSESAEIKGLKKLCKSICGGDWSAKTVTRCVAASAWRHVPGG